MKLLLLKRHEPRLAQRTSRALLSLVPAAASSEAVMPSPSLSTSARLTIRPQNVRSAHSNGTRKDPEFIERLSFWRKQGFLETAPGEAGHECCLCTLLLRQIRA